MSRPETQNAPELFYNESEAKKYHKSSATTAATNANTTTPRGDYFSENGDRVLFVPFSELDEMRTVNKDMYRGDSSKAIIFDHKLKVWILPAKRGIDESLYQKWLKPCDKWIKMNSKSPFVMQAVTPPPVEPLTALSHHQSLFGGMGVKVEIKNALSKAIEEKRFHDALQMLEDNPKYAREKEDSENLLGWLPLHFACQKNASKEVIDALLMA